MPGARDPLRSHSFEAIGTAWSIESADTLEVPLLEEIHRLIDRFDLTWSRFRDDSLISRIATTPGDYALPEEATPLFEFYRALYDLSHGRVTPLVGRSLEALGYDKHYSLIATPGPLPPIPAWDDAVSFYDGVLTAPKPVLVDVGACGKGLLVDLVMEHLLESGHTRVLVDASGDLRRSDTTGSIERVGLENPANPALALGVAEINTGALAASGTNKRRWASHLHHVLDGVTGLPSTGVMASWVVARDAMTADGVATALLLAPPEPFAEAFDIEWVTLSDSGVVRHSPGFPGEVFS
jgi:thiamine biosynthesis lipoprotein